jgi:hypothetical protein
MQFTRDDLFDMTTGLYFEWFFTAKVTKKTFAYLADLPRCILGGSR